MSVNEANQSEVELLRQRIRELEAENAEIPNLRRKISEFDAERAELKRRIAEVLKMRKWNRSRLKMIILLTTIHLTSILLQYQR
ncbi:hypothetical protein RhiirC2_761113 [Rhizophagus irregularis]|uniref:Uncharacterized protein n=1 Tax=Rhizophagus irregularis TaxID=588596 RepID=A0A2N1MHM3_9GLOM|nr:hypothetical protein RhiirC2_761113 [Rhizophagus irregularis]